MYAKQYEITLPADYDMQTIRKRVADGGHVLDDRAGLRLKAYVIRERGINGSPVNQYAPFYLWNDTGAMAHFLVGGGGFENVIRDFGRPVARHWTAIACHAGPARTAPPRAASRRLTAIPCDADPDGTGLGLSALIEREAEQLLRFAGQDGVHTAALAVDPTTGSCCGSCCGRTRPRRTRTRLSATRSCTCPPPAWVTLVPASRTGRARSRPRAAGR